MTRYNQPLGGNEMPRFGGPATMMRLPAATSANGLDAAFIGIPMDHAPRTGRARALVRARSATNPG